MWTRREDGNASRSRASSCSMTVTVRDEYGSSLTIVGQVNMNEIWRVRVRWQMETEMLGYLCARLRRILTVD